MCDFVKSNSQTDMDISALVHLPVRISPEFCQRNADGVRYGMGLAACADLGLLVISSGDRLQVFSLPDDIVARCHVQSELAHVGTLGGVAPIEFQFCYSSGYMAFTDGCGGVSTANTANRRLLLVTDYGKSNGSGAVHVIDVVRGTHVGYVAAPGTIMYPSGVATRKSLAAVSCWDSDHAFQAVRVFEGSGASWTAVRVIVGGNSWPSGLRFTADCSRLVVANGRGVSIVCAKDGSFLRHIDAEVYPKDVEECDFGWIMCLFGGLAAVSDDAGPRRREFNTGYHCSAVAVVPGLGLLVVRHDTGVHFLATPDAVAMAAMSSCKVAWMVAVCRAAILRARDGRTTAITRKRKHRFS